MTRNPKVLIIILNYRRYDLTIKIINELHSNLDYSNYSIMVVDNCSPDESAKVLEEKKDSMNFIFYANKNNSGYAAGNNIGIRYGIKNGYDYSWILNNDVEILDRDVLKQLISKAESDTSIACIGPKVYSSFNKAVPPFCNRPTLWSYSLGLKQERDYRRTQIDISRRVYCIYGCCVLLRNEAMKEIDCMDERTFLYDEEVILAERLLSKDYSSFYLPTVSVRHNEGSSTRVLTRSRLKMRIKECSKSRNLYLKDYRHFSAPARWLCLLTRACIIYIRK